MSIYWDDEEITPELEEIHRLRDLALRSPLRRGNFLTWIGPTHIPSSLPPISRLNPDRTSPGRQRTPFKQLLSEDGPAKSSERWNLKLIEPLQTGANEAEHWGQVWRAQVAREGEEELKALPVVIKLYQEALYPDPRGRTIPEFSIYARLTADQTESTEARFYSRARALQGNIIPLCYGFYRFRLPNGGDVPGVVLEDLSEICDPICDFVNQLDHRQELTYEAIDTITCTALENLNQIHLLSLSPLPSFSDMFVLRSSTSSRTQIVFIDFSESRTREEVEKAESRHPEFFQGVPDRHKPRFWLSADHFALIANFDYIIGDKFEEWTKRERVEQKHQLMGEPHHLVV